MANIPGIPISSGFVKNSPGPLNKTQRLSTSMRLNLSFVQRWLGMTTYDTDLNVWKVLISNPAGDTTVETNWDDFGGGFSGTGIYVTDVLVGDSQGDVIITHDLETRDLHVSYFTLPFYEKTTLDCTLNSNNSVTVRGYGADQTVHVVIGTGGSATPPGTNPSVAIAITYAEAETLIGANELVAGLYYKITDYQTVVDMGSKTSGYIGTIHTGAIEELIVRANTDHSLDIRAYSEAYPDDDIDYDFNDNSITNQLSGGWEEGGGDFGDSVTVSNVLVHSFEVNKEFIGPYFYLYLEDDSNNYEYEWSDLDTKFTITDIGGGQYRIDLIDTATDPMSLVGTGSGYIELEGDVSIASRKGSIIRRKNRERNIETTCDFRENTRLRFRVDLTDLTKYPVYNSGTSYNQRDMVQYNGDIYLYMPHKAITGQTPSVSSRYWALLVRYANDAYIFGNNGTGGVSHTLDPIYKEVPMLGQYDRTTQTFNKDLFGMINVSIESEDVVVVTEIETLPNFENIVVGADNDRISLFGNKIKDLHIINGGYDFIVGLDANVTDNFTKIKLNRTVISYSMRGCKASYMSNVTIVAVNYSEIGYNLTNSFLNNLYYSKIREAVNSIFIGYAYYFDLGASSNNFYMYYAYRIKFGSGCYRVYNYSNQFSNSSWENEARRLHFESGIIIEQFNVLNRMGPLSGERVISCGIRNSQAGNEFLTYGVLDVGNYVGFSKFGDNCRGFTVGGLIYNSNFGSNCQSFNVTGNINNSNFGNSVYTFTAQNVSNSNFGNSIGYVNVSGNISGVTIGSGSSSVVTASGIRQSVLGTNVSFTSNYTSDIFCLECKSWVQSIVIPSTATWLGDIHNKEMYIKPDGGIRCKYVDNTDVVQYFDPTV